jgi:alpha-beta hydrolase superfamily lysophospholipase
MQHRYWDVEVKPDQYSYVNAALSEGYSIFTYDRLGTGASDKPDAYDIVQTTVQVEILRQLTSLARAGKLVRSSKKISGSSASVLGRYTPSKIIHVGHSFGSVATIGLLTQDGAASDGAIITGFLYNDQLAGASVATWGFEFARQNDPVLFGDRPSGYIVQATKSNTQISFLKEGSFEPALLDYAWKIRQPNSVSEFVSIGEVLFKPAPDFKGPILVSCNHISFHLSYETIC